MSIKCNPLWILILLIIIVIIIVIIIISIAIFSKTSTNDYVWVQLPFYQKLRHLGSQPPEYAHILADKYSAKKIVEEKCPDILIAKLVYVTDTEHLPKLNTILEPEKSYIMKATNASSRNKKINIDSDIIKLSKLAKKWLTKPYRTSNTSEKFYGQIKPQILIEEMIDDIAYEYRIYCFHGTPHYIRVKKSRIFGISYYTPQWKKTEIGHRNAPYLINIPEPDYLDKILLFSEQLSKGIAFVCVDICATIKGNLYFLEFTFCPNNSEQLLSPKKCQEIFSNLWKYRD